MSTELCLWCLEPSPVQMHKECVIRSIVGSVGHQLNLCSCHGGLYDDPPDMTRRQAARAAAKLFMNPHAQRELVLMGLDLWLDIQETLGTPMRWN